MLVPCGANLDLDIAVIPSRCSLFFSLVASVLLLWIFRLAFQWATRPVDCIHEKSIQSREKKICSWGIFTWQSLPDCPISFSIPPVDTVGRGVGLAAGRTQTTQRPHTVQHGVYLIQVRLFSIHIYYLVAPLQPPSPYNSREPVCAAKIIMSRHVSTLATFLETLKYLFQTFRRPGQTPPRRSLSQPAPPLVRQQSMV